MSRADVYRFVSQLGFLLGANILGKAWEIDRWQEAAVAVVVALPFVALSEWADNRRLRLLRRVAA
jgi:hypothetical protein